MHPAPGHITKEESEELSSKLFVSGADPLNPDRAKITARLLYILVGTILAYIISMFYFSTTGNADGAKNMSNVFNALVPVVSSLVSSAVTWYFTGGSR